MAGQFHAPSHPGVLKNLNMNGIYFRDILLTRISRGANNCGQHPLEKNIYFIMRFLPHFQLFYFNDRLEFCKFFEGKLKRINNADLFFTAAFAHIYQGLPILVEGTVFEH